MEIINILLRSILTLCASLLFTCVISIPIISTAAGAQGLPLGVLLLDKTDKCTLQMGGVSTFTVSGSSLAINSTSSDTICLGGPVRAIAPAIAIVGSFSVDSPAQLLSDNIVTGAANTSDPLAYLPSPDQPPVGTTNCGSSSNDMIKINQPGTCTLSPGAYLGGVLITNPDAEVLFQQASAGNNGIYYFGGIGLDIRAGTVTPDPATSGGMMLFFSGDSGFSISSQRPVTFSALTEGVHRGVVVFQDRGNGSPININDAADVTFGGTVYGASAKLRITGSGNTSLGGQLVIDSLKITGEGNVTVATTP